MSVKWFLRNREKHYVKHDLDRRAGFHMRPSHQTHMRTALTGEDLASPEGDTPSEKTINSLPEIRQNV